MIYLEATPNPLTLMLKFQSELTDEPFDVTPFFQHSSILTKLIQSGLSSIFIGRDYISFTRLNNVDWELLKPIVLSILKDRIQILTDDIKSISANIVVSHPDICDHTAETIDKLIQNNIRPAVSHDGGDIKFHSFKNGILKVKMAGACVGCPSSSSTLQLGVKRLIQQHVPEVTQVVAA